MLSSPGWLYFLLFTIVGIHVIRSVLAYVVWRPAAREPFDGELLTLGHNLVCMPQRPVDAALTDDAPTLICFPGFVEDMRYFLAVHRDTPARLIIINNANYHNPFAVEPGPAPDWLQANPHRVGTIEHDAFCVNQVIEHLGGGGPLYLHGHSRGGAVMLEAGRQRPDLAARVTAVLEAAVVPKGRLANNGERMLQPIGLYLLPFVFAVMRWVPEHRRIKSPMMWVTNANKNSIVAAIPFVPRQYATAVTQSANIIQWQATSALSVYNNFADVWLVVGERDHVLWRKAMVESARQSERVRIIETSGTDHFPSLEKPDLVSGLFAGQA